VHRPLDPGGTVRVSYQFRRLQVHGAVQSHPIHDRLDFVQAPLAFVRHPIPLYRSGDHDDFSCHYRETRLVSLNSLGNK
jgi:hypothetical protein